MEKSLINRVSQSGLTNLNLEKWYPEHPIALLDIKPFLYMGLIVKEKEFRESLKSHNWDQYKDQIVIVYCSNETILPVWAKMLISAHLVDKVHTVYFGDFDAFLYEWYKNVIDNLDISSLSGQRIIIKGCSKKEIPDNIFAYLVFKLMPVVKSIMFGEACSNVPIFKRKEN